MNEMTPEQKRNYNKQEFKRKYGRFWLVYLALFGTAVLSGISGILLPIQREGGMLEITFWTILAGLYYAAGFLTNGEGAAYFWFDKLVDHDKDNPAQQVIAYLMLGISVATVLTTALASASFIAYLMGALSQFTAIPAWAQKWIVGAIPIFWVAHLVMGMLFKALSDEAAAERDSRAKIREIQTRIQKDKADARAQYWQDKAPDVARQLGELEAQAEIENMTIQLNAKRQNNTATLPQQAPQANLSRTMAKDVGSVELSENSPTDGRAKK